MNTKQMLSIILILVMSAVLFIMPAAATEDIVLGINALDVYGAEGHSLILTRKTGLSIPDIGNYFTWWRTVVFEYSDEAQAYVVTALSLTASGSAPKQCYIPEDGFVLAVNLGNDYGNINYRNSIATATYEAVANLKIGDKAYVSGVDLAKGTIDISGGNHWDDSFTSNAKIYIGKAPSGVEVYSPDRSAERLDQVKLSCEDGDIISCTNNLTISWEEVDGAEYYLVNINDTVTGDIGASLVSNRKVNETSITIPASNLTVGYNYRVSVSAVANGKRSSFNTAVRLKAVSDRAINGPFAGKKKIYAFGDSVTAFTGWVAMLEGELGQTVVNAGVGGDTTNHAMKRFNKDVLSQKPDIVFMFFGINDQAKVISTGQPLVSLSVYEKNYRTMIERLRDIGTDVILLVGHEVCTDNGYYVPGAYDLDYGTGNVDSYYEVIRKLAAEYNLNIIDMNARAVAETSAKMCAPGDGIHLSTYGHTMYAKWISDFMYDGYVEHLGLEVSEETSEDDAQNSKAQSSQISEESSETEISAESDEVSIDEEHSKLEKNILIFGSIAVVAVLTVIAFLPSKLKKKKNK